MGNKLTMSARNKDDSSAPPARREFARRLRELRVPRGFRTARSLARTLDIDENRYTRYERAEVEPDLDMIRRICEALGVTPNELLGVGPRAAPQETHAEGAPRTSRTGPRRLGADGPVGSRPLDLQTAAWLLAEAAALLKAHPSHNGSGAADGVAPLAIVKQTGNLYKALMDQPFEAITSLLSDPAIADADAAAAAPVKERLDRLVALLRQH